MHFMGFSDKWISWINGCLCSATALIMVNRSPTREYQINCDLRQGDPLSPFLFIIAMEGLHVSIEDAISAGLYTGITVNTLTLSHFFFADDALFIGEWSRANIKNMISILDCFHRVSRLKINFHKSNLVGIGIPFEEFSKRLSKWKASLLSIGSGTTLLTSVLGAIGDSSLKTQFPRIYRLALNQDCMVRDCWNNGWDLCWSRPILRGTILHQLSVLSSTLDTVSLSDSEDI
ncbi:RNA-directed DNA polymerase, eukaryota, reverse transcriptase zinc-binding domain protein [Tanacetum coccineum]